MGNAKSYESFDFIIQKYIYEVIFKVFLIPVYLILIIINILKLFIPHVWLLLIFSSLTLPNRSQNGAFGLNLSPLSVLHDKKWNKMNGKVKKNL